ncbi:lysophospholipid acyltransferase family protein [Niveispirillum sp. BGYR6]|uniref:lysophospholipid acyltransferase family protein n=1 Tax=Niveispirillum sp. BGYR6 TaxID=2971249 RepID=UPI0022B9BF19|nr:lysophospholipid acyltransferase family protein [Niveispirillum sp. BGYR6]MDG5495058.1 lysophospholipid acyltransferase family protein [Niveispirillum sp. BGYR6]
MSISSPGRRSPQRGGPVSRFVGRVALRLLGWRVSGAFPDLEKFVTIGAPHSSNYDFIIAMATILAIDLRIHILGKHTLFRGPLGPIMRWCDVLPVDRRAAGGVVGECVAAIKAADRMVVGVAPEGTRMPKEGAGWKTGFWHIARQAGVPIIPVALDYATRTIRIGDAVETTPSMEADFTKLSAFYGGVKGARRQLPPTIRVGKDRATQKPAP